MWRRLKQSLQRSHSPALQPVTFCSSSTGKPALFSLFDLFIFIVILLFSSHPSLLFHGGSVPSANSSSSRKWSPAAAARSFFVNMSGRLVGQCFDPARPDPSSSDPANMWSWQKFPSAHAAGVKQVYRHHKHKAPLSPDTQAASSSACLKSPKRQK